MTRTFVWSHKIYLTPVFCCSLYYNLLGELLNCCTFHLQRNSSSRQKMARLVALFRTGSEIRDCFLYTKQCSNIMLDTQGCQTRFFFILEPELPDFWSLEFLHIAPHRYFRHVVFNDICYSPVKQNENKVAQIKDTVRDHFNGDFALTPICNAKLVQNERHIFMVPHYRCTLYLNGHLASCISKEICQGQRFRRHFLKNILLSNTFRDCFPLYSHWDTSQIDNMELMTIPYMVDIVAVWPEQRLDNAW